MAPNKHGKRGPCSIWWGQKVLKKDKFLYMKVGCFVGEKMVSSLQEKKEKMYLCNQNLRRELLKKLCLLPVGCEVE